jgi:hypothetical protein
VAVVVLVALVAVPVPKRVAAAGVSAPLAVALAGWNNSSRSWTWK